MGLAMFMGFASVKHNCPDFKWWWVLRWWKIMCQTITIGSGYKCSDRFNALCDPFRLMFTVNRQSRFSFSRFETNVFLCVLIIFNTFNYVFFFSNKINQVYGQYSSAIYTLIWFVFFILTGYNACFTNDFTVHRHKCGCIIGCNDNELIIVAFGPSNFFQQVFGQLRCQKFIISWHQSLEKSSLQYFHSKLSHHLQGPYIKFVRAISTCHTWNEKESKF